MNTTTVQLSNATATSLDAFEEFTLSSTSSTSSPSLPPSPPSPSSATHEFFSNHRHRQQRGLFLQGLVVCMDMRSRVSETSHKLQNILTSLGATITFELDEHITHLISSNTRSPTCTKALLMKHRPLIVSPSWILECDKQQKHVSEAPYLLYSLKEELELADGGGQARVRVTAAASAAAAATVVENCSSSIATTSLSKQGDENVEQLNTALGEFHIKPIAIRTKSTTLNELQLMPTPPELIRQRQPKTKCNIVVSSSNQLLKTRVMERIKRMGVYEYKRRVNEHTKVLVVDNTEAITANLLKALVLGIRIVTLDWVDESFEKRCWLNPRSIHCVRKWFPIYKRHHGRGMRNLFAGPYIFFISIECSLPYRTLVFLITHGGGKLTNKISEADVVISGYKPRPNISKTVSKTKSIIVVVGQWVVDCIVKGYRLAFKDYELDLTLQQRQQQQESKCDSCSGSSNSCYDDDGVADEGILLRLFDDDDDLPAQSQPPPPPPMKVELSTMSPDNERLT